MFIINSFSCPYFYFIKLKVTLKLLFLLSVFTFSFLKIGYVYANESTRDYYDYEFIKNSYQSFHNSFGLQTSTKAQLL